MSLKFKSTKEIQVSKKVSEQVIGQEHALEIIKKAAKQRRNVLLIGEPGTGKSLLGQALAELLPKEKLVDVLVLNNEQDENVPLTRTMPKGQGKEFVNKLKLESLASSKNQNIIFFILLMITLVTPWWIRGEYGDIMAAASLIGSMVFLAAFVLFMNLSKRMGTQKMYIPKLLIDNSAQDRAPFIDATGSHAGALLGDCLHDPLQTFYNLKVVTNVGIKKLNLVVNNLLKKHQNNIIKKGTYRAVYTTKEDNIKVLAEKNNKPTEVEVISVNKYNYNGELIKITTESGKEIIVTPEHKIATKTILGKKIYKEASKIKKRNSLFVLNS